MKFLVAFLVIGFLIPVPFAFSESMEVGKIYWKEKIISPNSFAEIIIEDNDMNKKEYPNWADKFIIEVWSDSSSKHIQLEVVETGIFTGKFKGRILISDTQSEGKKLFAKPGDTVYALYVDETIPQTDSHSEMVGAAVIKIKGQDMTEQLTRIGFSAESEQQITIPEWIKNNAGWWADGITSEEEFVSAMQYLIKENILVVPPTTVESQGTEGIPEWVKNNAGWWAQDVITDGEFINAMQYLIKVGTISIEFQPQMEDRTIKDAGLSQLEADLESCQEIKKAYERLNCEKEIKAKIAVVWYKENAQSYEVGPLIFYYPGVGTEGNSFEVSPSGQALLYIKMLAENTGSNDNIVMMCSGPSVCNYDITNGDKVFKYSSQDFTNGQIIVKPGESKEFNMFFGPNIGYGGTKFEYDLSKEYFFRISEPWGSFQIPLNLE